MSGRLLDTNIYIDGFNLYYRALRGTDFRWLDLRVLSSQLFPNDSVNRICFFTALVQPRPNDPGQATRQLIYHRALKTLPGVEIHLGALRPRTKRLPLAQSASGPLTFVRVLDSEEKGTDVNLATELLVDGFKGNFQKAVVISNDSDFARAMRVIRGELGLQIVSVNPDTRAKPHRDLSSASTYVKNIRRNHLRRSQLPATLTDSFGTFSKPREW